jgi:hypothetical protein
MSRQPIPWPWVEGVTPTMNKYQADISADYCDVANRNAELQFAEIARWWLDTGICCSTARNKPFRHCRNLQHRSYSRPQNSNTSQQGGRVGAIRRLCTNSEHISLLK